MAMAMSMSMSRSRHLYPAHEPSLVASAPDMLIVACADGFVRTYPATTTTVSMALPICEFETVYPSVTWIGHCAVHDTICTIEKRRGGDTGVVRVYYNWRATTASKDESAFLSSLEPATPFPASKKCGVPARVYAASTELSVYRLPIGAAAVAVACCESTGRMVVASGRGHVSLWEVCTPGGLMYVQFVMVLDTSMQYILLARSTRNVTICPYRSIRRIPVLRQRYLTTTCSVKSDGKSSFHACHAQSRVCRMSLALWAHRSHPGPVGASLSSWPCRCCIWTHCWTSSRPAGVGFRAHLGLPVGLGHYSSPRP